MPAALDISGTRYGKLVALGWGRVQGQRRWLCVCDCGGFTLARLGNLRSGASQSCGCEKEAVLGRSTTTHGLAGTKMHGIWKSMKQRCENPNHPRWNRYGGRGIKVCDRWQRFENFLADMGERPQGRTLDRRDNDKGYSPDNCRWATDEEQNSNLTSNRWIEWNGIRDTLSGWARRCQCDPSTVSDRLARHGPEHFKWFLK